MWPGHWEFFYLDDSNVQAGVRCLSRQLTSSIESPGTYVQNADAQAPLHTSVNKISRPRAGSSVFLSDPKLILTGSQDDEEAGGPVGPGDLYSRGGGLPASELWPKLPDQNTEGKIVKLTIGPLVHTISPLWLGCGAAAPPFQT